MGDNRTVNFVVPLDYVSGDTLCVNISSSPVDFSPPSGTKPGDTIQLQLSTAQPETTLPLHAGITLSFPPPLQSEGSDDTHLHLWPAGSFFARYLSSPACQVQGANCLELGSGSGAAGLALATKLGIGTFLLSDVPSALPSLSGNIDRNRHLLKNADVRAHPLEWGEEGGKADVLLGADLLYGPISSYQKLIHTIRSCHPEKILLCTRWRRPEKERVFFEEMEDFEFELVGGSCPLRWEEYGRGAASERWFRERKVQLERGEVGLGEVTEEDVEGMGDEAYQDWEEAQIQIYLGRPL